MAFCMNCGQKLIDGAKFCPSCGTPVGSVSGGAAGVEKESPTPSNMTKCPNCGSSINQIEAICPYCGSQVQNRKVASSVQRFADELNQIEKEATADRYKGITGFVSSIMEQGYGGKTLDRKLSLINSFPIPNTIEEIYEFVMLALGSIDVKWGKNSISNKMYGKPGSSYYPGIALANAWVNKLQQAYNKAKVSFPRDPIFTQIEEMYKKKMKELKRET